MFESIRYFVCDDTYTSRWSQASNPAIEISTTNYKVFVDLKFIIMLIKLYMLISLVFEDTKIEQDIYQAINSSFPRRIKISAKQIFITVKL